MSCVWRSWLAAIASLLQVGAAWAGHEWTPYHLDMGGPRVRVHYVHLKTEYDREHLRSWRERIEADHEVCRLGKMGKVLLGEDPGLPARPLPPGGVPAEPLARDVEIYYGAGRSVAVVTTSSYLIDTIARKPRRPDEQYDCSVQELHGRSVTVMKGLLPCEFYLEDDKVRIDPGCKVNAVRMEAEKQWWVTSGVDPRRGDSIVTRPSPTPQSLPDPTGPTGEWRSIAGHRCQVFGPVPIAEECIAVPDNLSRDHVSARNLNHPGLLLQFKSKLFTDTAQTVILNLEVGEHIFDIPKEGEAPPELWRLAR